MTGKNKPFFDPDERIVTLSDLSWFFLSQKKKWIRIAWIGALCSFCFFALRSPQYKAEATFKEGVEKSGAEGALKSLLGDFGSGGQQPQAIALMKSNQVLKPLVEKLGLQAQIVQSRWIVGKVLRRIRDNLRIEFGKPLDELDPFLFKNVVNLEENAQVYFLKFTTPSCFTIFNADRKSKIGEGQLGSPVSFSSSQFTVEKTPAHLKLGVFYQLNIVPWIPIVEGLRGQLKISSDKINKSIYNLSLTHRDRRCAQRLINELMASYQCYLKKDHDQLAGEQLAYLEKRQDQLYGKLAQTLDEHVSYMDQNLGESGFLGLDQESQSFLGSYQKMFQRRLDIDLELSLLERAEMSQPFSIPSYSNCGKSLTSDIQDLKQQRDLIEISLQQQHSLSTVQEEETQLAARRDELQEIRLEKGAVKTLKEEVGEGSEISLTEFDLGETLYGWAKKLEDRDEEREDLCEYLENYSRLLSLRESMLQERVFYGNKAPPELEGIDLETAGKLFVDYNNKIDYSVAAMRRYSQFREQVLLKDFELGSLSSILSDPLSQNLIASANRIALQLKDEKYHSSREGERWEDELSLQRKILSDHLAQLERVEEMNLALYKEKMASLQQVWLDGINRRISVLLERARSEIKDRREALLRETQILVQKMEEIRRRSQGLSGKWKLEKWLELKTEMDQKIMETLTQLVESKTIGHHLHHVESKPLDEAILPSSPTKQFLLRKALIGAFCAVFAVLFFSLVKTILRGFPLSVEKLQAMGLPTAGPLSFSCDGPGSAPLSGPDLDLLRRLALFSEGSKVIGLIGGKGPDYSYALGENLARMSYRSLILRCDFTSKFSKEDVPGLLQVWKKEIASLPIRKGTGFDYIPSGGHTPFGAEMLQSPSFAKWLEQLKENYDWVFLFSREPLSAPESAAVLRLCDKAVVTISKETTEQLTPFVEWAYHETGTKNRLTFVVAD